MKDSIELFFLLLMNSKNMYTFTEIIFYFGVMVSTKRFSTLIIQSASLTSIPSPKLYCQWVDVMSYAEFFKICIFMSFTSTQNFN